MTKNDPARQLIAKALGRHVSEITDAAAMGTPESWDSLGHMRILMEIEAQLGREMDPELAALIVDVKSVRNALSVT